MYIVQFENNKKQLNIGQTNMLAHKQRAHECQITRHDGGFDLRVGVVCRCLLYRKISCFFVCVVCRRVWRMESIHFTRSIMTWHWSVDFFSPFLRLCFVIFREFREVFFRISAFVFVYVMCVWVWLNWIFSLDSIEVDYCVLCFCRECEIIV